MSTQNKGQHLSFLSSDPTEPFSLVILNQPILIKREVMIHLWNKSAYRVTVDGGTDQWFEWLGSNDVTGLVNSGQPDLVMGDFDSIKPSTLKMLQEKSIPVENTPDQDLTDFRKAVICIEEKKMPHLIVAVCEVSGRLDQILSQLNTLHMSKECIVLLSSCCATWLLQTGTHEIDVLALKRNVAVASEPWIGLIPLGSPTRVSTSGLMWNLENTEMKFGGLISTSNTFGNEPLIKIKTDQPLVWSMGVSLAKESDNKGKLQCIS